MSDYTERRTVVEDIPIKRARPVVETQYDSVVHERQGMSGGAVAALVLAAIAAAVVITLLILNNQQKNNEDQLAQERARTQQALAQQPAQPAQQAPIVVMPSSPSTTPVPVPVPAPAAAPPTPTETAPSSAQVEIDVSTKLLDDSDLRSHPIDVKVAGRTAILSGSVPSDDLKTRAEKLARTVKGVGRVVNNITVQP
jgi:type IV secretory pathway VirB10-like protein